MCWNSATSVEIPHRRGGPLLARGAQVPAERWAQWELPLAEGPLDPHLLKRVGHAGFLLGADLFDAAFFRVTESEAARLDPHHRVLLEAAFEALAGALNVPGAKP